jgi:uncharacterized repeat protein (TIGR02543 family)/prepilin-type N-terminal cleavage/methylation domain-containing protein
MSVLGLTHKANLKGLTLIELLVTIAVISVIALISFPTLTNIIGSSRAAATEAIQKQANDFLSRYEASGKVSFDEETSTFTAWTDLNGDGRFTSPKEIIETLEISEKYSITVDNSENPTSIIVETGDPKSLIYKSGYNGEASDITQRVQKDKQVALASNPFTRLDYSFTGWNHDSDGSGITYNVGESLTIADNTTLYAQWLINTYTITYTYNGATSGNDNTTDSYISGGEAILLPAPLKSGYSFEGWNTDALGSGINYDGGAELSNKFDTALYAQWSANSYTLTYDYNGATSGNSIVNSSYTSGDPGVLLSSPERTGYSFSGWNTNNSGTGSNYAGGSRVTIQNDTTLFSQWLADTYTITYNYDGATGGNSSATSTYSTGESDVSLPAPTKSGKTFAGWFTASNFSGTKLGTAYSPSASLTLYAKWDNSTVVVFDASTGPNSTMTGGWSLWNYDGSNVSVGTNSNSVYTYSPYWTNGAAATNNNIDLTGATSITIDFAGSSDSPYGYSSFSWYKADGERDSYGLLNPSNRNMSRQLITIPITNGGSGRLTLNSANTRQYQYIYSITINY